MNSNIIHQLLLDVSLPPGSEARKLDERLRDFAMGPLVRSLDSLAPNSSVRLDRLEIDLGQFPLRTFLRGGADQIADAVSKHIVQEIKKNGLDTHHSDRSPSRFPFPTPHTQSDAPTVDAHPSSEQSTSEADTPADALLSFLITGYLPWWFPASRWSEATRPSRWASETQTSFFKRFLQVVSRSPHAALRLIRSVSASELITLLPKHPSRPNSEFPDDSETARRELLRNCFTQLPAAQQPPSIVLKHLAQPTDVTPPTTTPETTPPSPSARLPSSPKPSRTQTTEETKPSSLKTNDRKPTIPPQVPPIKGSLEDPNEIVTSNPNGIAITNAGLILLHPFLSRLFRSLDYLAPSGQLLPDTRWRAVQLLQYLAEGKSGLPEHTLLMEKTLCGIPLAEVAAMPLLFQQEKDEADTLLRAAIDHWSALGKTSPEGLRQSFLLREGLLYLDEEPIRLQVEKRPYDMLLDRLPWQFKYVLLPWIQTPLLVQWRT